MSGQKPLTGPQQAALDIVNAAGGKPMSSREVAKRMWPDSEAWDRRTRFGAVSNQGAMGGTMPMKAAQVLHRLADRGLIVRRTDNLGITTWVAI